MLIWGMVLEEHDQKNTSSRDINNSYFASFLICEVCVVNVDGMLHCEPRQHIRILLIVMLLRCS